MKPTTYRPCSPAATSPSRRRRGRSPPAPRPAAAGLAGWRCLSLSSPLRPRAGPGCRPARTQMFWWEARRSDAARRRRARLRRRAAARPCPGGACEAAGGRARRGLAGVGSGIAAAADVAAAARDGPPRRSSSARRRWPCVALHRPAVAADPGRAGGRRPAQPGADALARPLERPPARFAGGGRRRRLCRALPRDRRCPFVAVWYVLGMAIPAEPRRAARATSGCAGAEEGLGGKPDAGCPGAIAQLA